MNSAARFFTWSGLMVAGVALSASGFSSLKQENQLATDRNPMALQKSAYGRMLARLSESTIDRVWHLGVEQIVPHNISGDGHGSEGHAQSDGEHEQDHSSPSEDPASQSQKPAMERLKSWYNDMRVVKYHRTNPNSLSSNHLATVTRELEEMMLNSYKMDPSHYGVYNSYHLFLTTHKYGGTEAKRAKAKLIAETTMAEIRNETEDPEPWLTAASAAMNLYHLDLEKFMQKDEPFPLEGLYHYREMVSECLAEYDRLQTAASESGTWDNLSFERQFEIISRSRFLKRNYEPFDALIARAERKASPIGQMEAQVSDILQEIEP